MGKVLEFWILYKKKYKCTIIMLLLFIQKCYEKIKNSILKPNDAICGKISQEGISVF